MGTTIEIDEKFSHGLKIAAHWHWITEFETDWYWKRRKQRRKKNKTIFRHISGKMRSVLQVIMMKLRWVWTRYDTREIEKQVEKINWIRFSYASLLNCIRTKWTGGWMRREREAKKHSNVNTRALIYCWPKLIAFIYRMCLVNLSHSGV